MSVEVEFGWGGRWGGGCDEVLVGSVGGWVRGGVFLERERRGLGWLGRREREGGEGVGGGRGREGGDLFVGLFWRWLRTFGHRVIT